MPDARRPAAAETELPARTEPAADGDAAPARTGRRPGRQDTRGAILAAAREAFAARGFAGTSMRSIAAGAGVDAALIHHYFDTKQHLFLETMRVPVDLPALVAGLLRGGLPGLGSRLIRTVLEIWESEAQAALVTALRAVLAEPSLARGMREFLTLEVLGKLLRAMDVPAVEAERRAGLVAAHLVGLFVSRYLLELPAVAAQSRADLVAAVGPVLQHYLDGAFEHAPG